MLFDSFRPGRGSDREELVQAARNFNELYQVARMLVLERGVAALRGGEESNPLSALASMFSGAAPARAASRNGASDAD